MRTRRFCYVVATALLLAVTTAVATAQGPGEFVVLDEPEMAGAPEGIMLLSFDDGTIEAEYRSPVPFQEGTRFGGDAGTTTLVPMELKYVYWISRAYPFGALDAVNVNIWYPLTPGGFPADPEPLGVFPGTLQTGTTVRVTLGGTIIASANGSVMVGVGLVPDTDAGGTFLPKGRVPVDTNGGAEALAQRQFLGRYATDTFSWGPATISSQFTPLNWFIRLLVNANIPVELESFGVD